MIKISVDKGKSKLEIDGVSYYDALAELVILIHSMKTDQILSKLYPLADYIESIGDVDDNS